MIGNRHRDHDPLDTVPWLGAALDARSLREQLADARREDDEADGRDIVIDTETPFDEEDWRAFLDGKE